MRKILLAPDGADGGTPAADAPPTPTPTPTPAPAPAPAPAPTTTPPAGAGPAAVVVVTGTKTERELELERRNAELENTIKDRERTICEVQDKHENYRKSVEVSQPKKKKVGVGWFETNEDDTTPATP